MNTRLTNHEAFEQDNRERYRELLIASQQPACAYCGSFQLRQHAGTCPTNYTGYIIGTVPLRGANPHAIWWKMPKDPYHYDFHDAPTSLVDILGLTVFAGSLLALVGYGLMWMLG